MPRLIAFLLTIVAFGADNPWATVRALKTGTELRVYRKNAKQPILAKLAEATDENLVVIVKNEQTAIAKDEIDRIDFRPLQSGSRVTKETRTSQEVTAPTGKPSERGGGG